MATNTPITGASVLFNYYKYNSCSRELRYNSFHCRWNPKHPFVGVKLRSSPASDTLTLNTGALNLYITAIVINKTRILRWLNDKSPLSHSLPHRERTSSDFYPRFSALVRLPSIGIQHNPITSLKKFLVYFSNSRIIPRVSPAIKIHAQSPPPPTNAGHHVESILLFELLF